MLSHFFKTTFSIVFLIAVTAPSSAYSFDGPMEAKNRFPLYSHLDSFTFEKAALENSYSIDFSYSSVYFMKKSAEWDASLDMELAGLNLRAKKIIDDSLELGIDVPFVSFNAGFMDGMVNEFHGLFGFSSYGRQDRPKNDFLYEVKRNGVTIVKGESGQAGLSDIRLSAKKQLTSSDTAISIMLALDLPAGDAKKGYGNGNVGTDISLLMDRKSGESYATYYNLGIASPGDLEGYEKVEMRQFVFGGIALEMAEWYGLNLMAQMSFQGSPYPKTGIKNMDTVAIQLAFGARYPAGNGGSYDFTFTEDPNVAGAPDFTIGISYKKKY